MKAMFVTATGTDVGKTYVTAGIVRAMRERGRAADAIKPVMSGYDAQTPWLSDAAILLEAMGRPVTAETIAAIAPWRFAAPLSPDMAAAKEGRALCLADILKFCNAAIRAAPGIMLVEGAGGAMAPLDPRYTMRDWIINLKQPALLVTGSYLGAISHTLTTAEALLRAGSEIAAVVLSESGTSPVPAAETAASISKFLPGIALHIIPRHLNDQSFRNLADFVAGY